MSNPHVAISAGSSIPQEIAEQHKWATEVAFTPELNIKKLLANRTDVILESNIWVQPYLSGKYGLAARKLEPPVQVIDRYVVVSKEFYNQFPEFTNKFWLNICLESRKAKWQSLPACN